MNFLRHIRSIRLPLAVLVMCMGLPLPAGASYIPFNTSTNMNIGIGTSTPQAAFVVTNGNVGVGTWTSANTLGVSGGVGIGTIYSTASAPANGLLVQGNIGVGSTAPGTQLDIQGKARITATGDGANLLYINGGTYSTAPMAYMVTARALENGVSLENTASGPIYYRLRTGDADFDMTLNRVGGSEIGRLDFEGEQVTKMSFITSSGNLGMGTTIPANKLAIVGNIGIGTIVYSPFMTTAAPGGGMIVEGNVGIGTVDPQTKLAVIGGNVGLGTWTADNARLETDGFRLSTGALGGYVLVSGSTGIGTWMAAGTLPSTGAGGSNPQLQYNNNGSIGGVANSGADSSGNIGIGTSTPQTTLAVLGPVGIGTWTQPAAGTGLAVFNGNVGIGSWAISNATASHAKFEITGDGNTELLRINDSGPNDTTPSINISSSGNMGIGTTASSPQLSVLGGFAAATFTTTSSGQTVATFQGPNLPNVVLYDSSSSLGNGPRLHFRALNNNPSAQNIASISTYMTNRTAGSTAGDLYFSTMTGEVSSERMRITAVGNIGIGTTVPASLLSVAGGVGIGTGFNSTYVSTTAPSGGMILEGNVGIGTTTPQAKLAVIGGNVGLGTWTAANARLETDGFRLSTGALGGYVLVSGSTGIGTWMASTTLNATATPGGAVPSLQYNNNGAMGGILNSGADANGNVGIGTTGPRTLLEVVGGNIGIGTAYSLVGVGTTSTILSMHTKLTSIYVGWEAGGELRLGAGDNAAVGHQALYKVTGGSDNSALGSGALYSNTTGVFNTAVGKSALSSNVSGGSNTALGMNALQNFSGSNVTAVGYQAGKYAAPDGVVDLTSASQSTFLGEGTSSQGDGNTNETVIGYNAAGNGSNSVTLGNTSVVKTILWRNVGIGTITPVSALAVVGNIGIGTGINSPFVTTTAPSGGMIVQGNVGIGTVTPQDAFVVTNGNVGIGTWAPRGLMEIGGRPNVPFIVDASGNVGLGTTKTNSAGLSIMNGNVGLGTWVPEAALQIVHSTSRDALRLYNTTTGNNTLLIAGSQFTYGPAVNLAGDLVNFGNNTSVSGSVNSTFFTINPASNNTGSLLRVRNGTSATAVLHVDTNANVGIGTINPVNKLSVNGNVGIGTNINSTFVRTTAPSGGMIVEGNVGIGTVDPQTKLAVLGNVGLGTWTADNARLETDGFRLSTGPQGGYVLVSGSTGIGTWMAPATIGGSGTPGGASPQLQYNNGGVFGGITNSNVNASGNVGLGTTFSTNKLDVNGGVGIGTAYAGYFPAPSNGLIVQGGLGVGTQAPGASVEIASTKNPISGPEFWPSYQLLLNNSSNNGGEGAGIGFAVTNDENVGAAIIYKRVGVNSRGELQFYTKNSLSAGVAPVQRMVIDAPGRVGIGTIDPLSTLSVAATVGVGIGTANDSSYLRVSAPAGGMIVEGNIGIGTSDPQTKLAVVGGNVGIGTWTTTTALDTQGFRLFTGPQQGGYVLVSGSTGIGTWMAPATIGAGGGTPGGASPQLQYNSGGTFGAVTSGGTDGTNIGIGTVSFVNRLNIVGNVGISTLAQSPYVNSALASPSALVIDGNVGIGTWQPEFPLRVASGVNGNSIVANGNIISAGGGAYGLAFVDQSNSNYYLDPAGDNVNGNYSMVVAKNVGIGTTTPQTFLSVNGPVGIGTWTNQAGVMMTVRGGNVGIGTFFPQDKLIVYNGNVGVGTWTTQARLDTDGFRLSTSPQGGYVLVSTTTGIGTWMASTTLNVNATAAPAGQSPQIQYNNAGTTGAITSGGTDGTNIGIGTVSFVNRLNVAGNVGISTLANSFYLTSALDIQTTLAVEGRVGIGTWQAGYPLEVRLPGANSGQIAQFGNVVDGIWLAMYGQKTSSIQGAPAVLNSYPSHDFSFGASDTEVFRITTGKNMGIGTITPVSKLAVVGNVGVGTGINSAYLTTTAPSGGMIVEGHVGIGTWSAANVVPGTSASLLVTGNIGISTVVPGQPLDINGNMRTRGTSSHFFGDDNKVAITASAATTPDMRFLTNSAEIMRITNGGNVGIGTTTPQTFFAIEGNVGIATWTAAGGRLIVGAGNVGIATAVPGQALDVNGAGRFLAQGDSYLNAGGGNVGVGTTTPQAKFVVVGGNVGIGTWTAENLLRLGLDDAVKPNGGSWSAPSDTRLKTDVAQVTDALAKISQLKGVTFRWVHPEVHGGSVQSGGFLAQEVEKVFPEFVREGACEGEDCKLTNGEKAKSLTLPFTYDAYVVEAIKELAGKVEKLDEQVRELKSQNKNLRDEIQEFKSLLEMLGKQAMGGHVMKEDK